MSISGHSLINCPSTETFDFGKSLLKVTVTFEYLHPIGNSYKMNPCIFSKDGGGGGGANENLKWQLFRQYIVGTTGMFSGLS